ncbi:hypothetical protein SAMN04488023_10219 [Pedobacter rhizosphaerae]|uniref:Uncharacterized protein n=1 Tax=Pedobacter rhizosphaerae TaxID=390241 RepID=A0A1H9JQH7_9SPHI|nr:hypothetical protein SAMN04488023_10219 [Pedobacter rhizosphaerae]
MDNQKKENEHVYRLFNDEKLNEAVSLALSE